MLEPGALALVINQVPVERLVPALSRMDAAFQGAVLAALSARTRRMVESDLQSGSEVAPRDVAEARRAIVDVVMKLAAQGQIELPSVASGEPPAQMREDDHG